MIYKLIFLVLDHCVNDWPLMSSLLKPIALALGYQYVVLSLGPRLMKNRKPFNIDRLIQFYNLPQVFLCIYLIKEVNLNIGL